MDSKRGFTLAEVLVTLAIIGVVAALTIPAVIRNYQKQMTVDRLKTAYGTISKILQTAEAEHGSIASWFSEGDIIQNNTAERRRPILDNFANIYVIPYVNATDSGRKPIKDFGYKNGVLNPDKTVWVGPEASGMGIGLANGMFMYIGSGYHAPRDHMQEAQYQSITQITFVVDIDGPKGANTLGKDTFVFVKFISSDLKLSQLRPYGNIYSVYYSDTKTFTDIRFNTREELLNVCKTHGTWCAALIMKDGWKISDDYPWL